MTQPKMWGGLKQAELNSACGLNTEKSSESPLPYSSCSQKGTWIIDSTQLLHIWTVLFTSVLSAKPGCSHPPASHSSALPFSWASTAVCAARGTSQVIQVIFNPDRSTDTHYHMDLESSWQEYLKLALLLRRMCGAVPRGRQEWMEHIPLMVKRMSGSGCTSPSCGAAKFH